MSGLATGCLSAATADDACEGAVAWRVVYRSSRNRKAIDTEGPYCFRHGLRHVDRAVVAATMAVVELEPIPAGTGSSAPADPERPS